GVSGLMKLGDVTDVLAGVGFPKEMQGRQNGAIPVFKVGDISAAWLQGEIFLTESRNYLSQEDAKSLGRLVPAGATVFAKIGEALRLNRRVMLGCAALVDNNVMGLVPDETKVSPKYLYYFMQTVDLGELSRSTTVPSIRKSDVLDIPINVPGLAEQDEIVAELETQFSRLDEAVANLQRVKANLKRYKASVLKAAVEGLLVETEASIAQREGRSYETGEQLLQRILEERRAKWTGRGKYKPPVQPPTDWHEVLPEGWTVATADQLTYLITSGSRGWGNFYSDTGILFIRAQDIKTDVLNFHDAARVDVSVDAEGTRSSVSAGDILVTITGANVTKSALAPELNELAFVSQHVALMKLAEPETAPFVFNWIVSPANGRKALESWAYGAGKPGLSLEQVRSLPIALPPLEEQIRIVAEVDRHLSIIREVEAEVDANSKRAQSLRQSVLSKVFLGSAA
ncbi:MAG: restriction endonuclease subunit S, partial [Rhodoferax sp.]